ncbi:MAG: hypothetical protein PQ612_01075 [Rickettsiales bacterium]|nr:hypothetical protein [Pseudomonadota bacterium]MDA0965492.1 hypothetical protein [Pseudomonadota bacterium]MDG4542816.1 hypothetical protein [Rickettsiales bacterium]MDG4544736.1 hypothetical protein [Rickettsiales bacterium]MDG4546858.1 hypothetical protein [Rickettsiales bacterium]
MPSGQGLTEYQKSKIRNTYQHELDDIDSTEEVKNNLLRKTIDPKTTPLYAQAFFNPKKFELAKAKTDNEINVVPKGTVREYILETLQDSLEKSDFPKISEDDTKELMSQFNDNKSLLRRGNVQRLNDAHSSFTSRWVEGVERVGRNSGAFDMIERINRRLDGVNDITHKFVDKLNCFKRDDDPNNRGR